MLTVVPCQRCPPDHRADSLVPQRPLPPHTLMNIFCCEIRVLIEKKDCGKHHQTTGVSLGNLYSFQITGQRARYFNCDGYYRYSFHHSWWPRDTDCRTNRGGDHDVFAKPWLRTCRCRVVTAHMGDRRSHPEHSIFDHRHNCHFIGLCPTSGPAAPRRRGRCDLRQFSRSRFQHDF